MKTPERLPASVNLCGLLQEECQTVQHDHAHGHPLREECPTESVSCFDIDGLEAQRRLGRSFAILSVSSFTLRTWPCTVMRLDLAEPIAPSKLRASHRRTGREFPLPKLWRTESARLQRRSPPLLPFALHVVRDRGEHGSQHRFFDDDLSSVHEE